MALYSAIFHYIWVYFAHFSPFLRCFIGKYSQI